MSSRSKGKEKAGYYPTQWSKWEWDENSRRYKRYRLKKPDDYEFEFDPPLEANLENVPRYLPPIAETPTTTPALSNYQASTSANVNTLASAFQRTGISSSSGPSSSFQQAAPSQPPTTLIRTRDTGTTKEKFDSHYKVHGQHEFQWGRVFKILWAEPKGNGGNAEASDGTISVREGKHGETHWEKVRRFLIVEQRKGHCICLPINTYSKQGTLKNGVHANDHTIIYTGSEPEYFKGEYERGLTRTPIRMTPEHPRHKLETGSRLNYAKLYTVEYNVKVWFIGRIHNKSQNHVAADYNDVHPPMQPPGPSSGASIANSVSYSEGGTTPYAQYGQYSTPSQTSYNSNVAGLSFATQPVSTLLPTPYPTSTFVSEPPTGDNASQSEGLTTSEEAGGGSYSSGRQYQSQSGESYNTPGQSSYEGAMQQSSQSSRGQYSARDTGSRSQSSSSHHKHRKGGH